MHCEIFILSSYLHFHTLAEGRGLLTDTDLDDIKDSSGRFSDGEDGCDADMKAVTVRFARGGQNEKEKYEKLREKSYEYQQKKLREEPWVKTNFLHCKYARLNLGWGELGFVRHKLLSTD